MAVLVNFMLPFLPPKNKAQHPCTICEVMRPLTYRKVDNTGTDGNFLDTVQVAGKDSIQSQ